MKVQVYEVVKKIVEIEVDTMPMKALEVSKLKKCSLPAVYSKITRGELTITTNGLIVVDDKLNNWVINN
jgi:hypothetical protein